MEQIATFPIAIDGRSYHVEIGSWRARDVTDFSPKTTIPGTGSIFADLQMYQPVVQSNWQHGFGWIWHEDEAGYLNSDGRIDTRHKGAVTMFTASTESDTGNATTKNGGLVYNTNFFTWGDGGIRYYDGSSWNQVTYQRPVFDAASEGSGTSVADSGTVTVSHTIYANGENQALFVGVIIEDATNVTDVTATYGGVAMNLVSSSSVGTAPNVRAFEATVSGDSIPTGANDIVVTYSLSSGTIETVVLGASFLYVNQDTPYDTVATNNDTGATTSTITTTVGGTDVALDFLAKDGDESGDAASTQETGQSEIAQDDETTGSDIHGLASQILAVDGTSTIDSTWSWTNSRDFAHLGIPINAVSDAAVDFLFENGEYLFAQPSGNVRLLKSAGGTADYSAAGVNNASDDYSWLEIHGGYLFAGKSSEPEVYFDSNSDLSALAGDPEDDTDELIAGAGAVGTTQGISFLERLAVTRSDGLWTIDTDDASTTSWISKRTLNFSAQKDTTNFRSITTNGGSLYFPIQDRILYEWNGSRLQNITPAPITDSWQYTTYYRFNNLTPFGDWLLFTARTSDSTYTESIIMWDGVGFHKVADPITDGDGSITMVAIDTQNDYIWYHVSSSAGENTYYLQYNESSDFAYANYPTSGTHQLTTSRIHAGFRRVTKSTPTLWLEVDNLSTTRTIEVQYALDDGSFRTWDTLVSSGIHTLHLPQNKLTEEFEYIRLRFIFTTATATETPVLENYALMVMMRPDFKMGYTFDIFGGTNMASGMFEDDRTGRSIMMDLRSVRDRKEPVELITPFGHKVWGYLTSITETAVEYEPEDFEGGDVNILQVIRCNFVEVLSIEGEMPDPAWAGNV